MKIRTGVLPRGTALSLLLLLSMASACDKPSGTPVVSGDAPSPAGAVSPEVAKSSTPPVFDDNFLRNEPKRYSQFREEVVVRHYFKDRRDGFFLDVGAAEWQKSSVTYYLESELGWRGIAIDARAELAAEYAANRPKTRFFSYLVTNHSGATEKFYLAGRLSSGHKDHLKKFEGAKDVQPKEVEVASITLDDLLAREKVERIDFMNMDIEGFEPPALEGFDIERYSPELVCIESAPQTREAIMKYFTEHGYRRMDELFPIDSVNWYFEKKKS